MRGALRPVRVRRAVRPASCAPMRASSAGSSSEAKMVESWRVKLRPCSYRCTSPLIRCTTPFRREPMPIGQVTGAHWMPSTDSTSSSRSIGLVALAVELVDEGHDRRVAQAADFHQLDRAFLDALGDVDHHQRRVDRGQHAVGVLAEVGVAGRVEQVDDAALVRELHHRGGDRDAALLFQRHPVGGGVARGLARLDRAGHLDRAAEQQQLFGQRGLAGVGMRDDGEGAAAAGFAQVLGHGRAPRRERQGPGKEGQNYTSGPAAPSGFRLR